MFEIYNQLIEKRLKKFINEIDQKKIYLPVKYILNIGGKRIRPSLVLLSVEMFDGSIEKHIDQAFAIELFHNFTLLHDDIMDDAPLRRGKQTVHAKWDVNKAILSGDIMFAMANSLMINCDEKYCSKVMSVFNQIAIEICEGQDLDMEFENRDDVSVDEYLEMIRLKTSVLLAGSLKIGAILSGANKNDIDLLYNFGIDLGIAFQIHDDILDVYAEKSNFGKQIAGDILENKKTLLLLKAKEIANEIQRHVLTNVIADQMFSPKERVKAVVTVYNELGIKEDAEKLKQEYYENALSSLNKLSLKEEKKEKMMFFAKQLMNRKL